MHRAGRPRDRRDAGFTLVELMIALAVLGFGLLAMTLMQLTAMSGARAGRHTTQAAVIARDQMETFQRLAWASPQLAATAGWTAPVAVTNVPDGAPGVEQSYALSWRVTNVDASWIKNIDVRVTWNEPSLAGKTLTISGTRYNDPW
ncbi:MAG: prepilin-type N-terminal cleavage/methylation domain-containing protein [Deltaproteobacteria bacterium]|nr:prepilin-type N-terminal cleavage/methylation domain-containing protein [Deltaproteobacteria bacterium]